MVIIKLKGGLGNQLFQYALGRSIEIKTQQEVKFDLSWFNRFPQREYGLSYFNTEVIVATKTEVLLSRKWSKKDGRRYLPLNILRHRKSLHLEEPVDGRFCEKILNLNNKVYLDGSWQSYKYFEKNRKLILQEFTLRKSPSSDFRKIKNKIKDSHSVSLHIRRGDYTTKKVQSVLKLCSQEYYQRAISTMKKKVENPTFFIFSDDIEWVKKNIKTNTHTIFVSNKNITDYEELILMSFCVHNITANSSFSWWAAWLNRHKNKIVITPKEWFSDTRRKTDDLIPEDWIQL